MLFVVVVLVFFSMRPWSELRSDEARNDPFQLFESISFRGTEKRSHSLFDEFDTRDG